MILLRAREPASGGVRNRMSTQYCGLVSQTDLGRIVSLCGWVARRRDHGGVILSICVIGRALFRSYATQIILRILKLLKACVTNIACRCAAQCARGLQAVKMQN